MAQIEVKRGELDKAIRKLKKMVDKEDTLKDLKRHRYYSKPSERKRQKRIEAKNTRLKIKKMCERR